MSKRLIITEKPSVAQQFAKTLKVSGKQDGYIENDEWVITWCVGHLVTLSFPEKYDPALKKWSLETIPFLPETYKYEVVQNVKKQFSIVKKLLNRPDVSVIYNAGDSGREGEYIQRLVFQESGTKKPVKRVWIDSQTDAEILRGIKEAKDSSEYDRLSDAAYMRAIEDYAIGINFSRALSCKFGWKFNQDVKTKKYTPIAVGRVMTCVLGMIVEREREIENFVPVDYFRLEADHGDFKSSWKAVDGSKYFESDLLYNDGGFRDKKDAEVLLRELEQDPALTVVKAETKSENKSAPLLYNLAELQSDCSKALKISPDETLKIAQSLYEKKLTTYPRTDARVISSAVAKELDKTLNGLSKDNDGLEGFVKAALGNWKSIEKSRYCDDKKITDHYAIIPTGDTGKLDGLEAEVYKMIKRRFLAIFFPPAEYKKTNIEFVHANKEKFFASEKFLVKLGYLEVMGEQLKDVSENLTGLKNGDVSNCSFQIATSTTQSPKRYTSGSMILAMENAGNLIEDEELREQIKGSGIGTSATRAEVINKLCKNFYIKLDKKTQVLSPSEVGFAVYDIVKDNIPNLLSPKMTANWEKGLSQIENGEITAQKYRGILEKFVRDTVEEVKGKAGGGGAPKPVETDIICPECGENMVRNSKCYTSDCGYRIFYHVAGVELDEETIEEMMITGRTKKIDGFKSKKGNKFSAYLVLQPDGSVKFEFE